MKTLDWHKQKQHGDHFGLTCNIKTAGYEFLFIAEAINLQFRSIISIHHYFQFLTIPSLPGLPELPLLGINYVYKTEMYALSFIQVFLYLYFIAVMLGCIVYVAPSCLFLFSFVPVLRVLFFSLLFVLFIDSYLLVSLRVIRSSHYHVFLFSLSFSMFFICSFFCRPL